MTTEKQIFKVNKGYKFLEGKKMIEQKTNKGKHDVISYFEVIYTSDENHYEYITKFDILED